MTNSTPTITPKLVHEVIIRINLAKIKAGGFAEITFLDYATMEEIEEEVYCFLGIMKTPGFHRAVKMAIARLENKIGCDWVLVRSDVVKSYFSRSINRLGKLDDDGCSCQHS